MCVRVSIESAGRTLYLATKMSSTNTIGTISEFQPENETIAAYLERVALFFEVNNIADEKKVSWLLNVMRAKTYSLLRTLVAPSQPKEKTMEGLVAVFKQPALRRSQKAIIRPDGFTFTVVIKQHKRQLQNILLSCAS